jgi:hypothetical protein
MKRNRNRLPLGKSNQQLDYSEVGNESEMGFLKPRVSRRHY